MFSIGISEVILVVVVGCLVTDPKKLPSIMKTAIGYYKKFDEARTEILDSFREIYRGGAAKSDSEEAKTSGTKQIVGDDGVVYEAYEVRELVETRNRSRRKLSSSEENAKSLSDGVEE